MKYILQFYALFIGIFSSIKRTIKNEAKWLLTKFNYRHVKFLYGSVVSGDCIFGKKIKIYEQTKIHNTSIGDNSYVGSCCVLNNCNIGKFCSIAPECRIGVGLHPSKGIISCYPGFYSTYIGHPVQYHSDASIQEYKKIIIKNDVWIGIRVIIIDGVTIGDGAIIGAGSVVTQDVPPYAVVGGVPARLIRKRFSDDKINRLIELAWWDRNELFFDKYANKFIDEEMFFDFFDEMKNSNRASQ